MNNPRWKITTTPSELQEGLFGQVILLIFEILPFLERSSVSPTWDIKSQVYGVAPDYTVIPGLFDPVTVPHAGSYAEMPLWRLRLRHLSVLGGIGITCTHCGIPIFE